MLSSWEMDVCAVEATMYTNHQVMLNVPFHQSTSIHPSISLEEFLYGCFMMKRYSRHYCLIKYWFFIIDETWILIFSLRLLCGARVHQQRHSESIVIWTTNLYVSCNVQKLFVLKERHLERLFKFVSVICRDLCFIMIFSAVRSLSTLVERRGKKCLWLSETRVGARQSS